MRYDLAFVPLQQPMLKVVLCCKRQMFVYGKHKPEKTKHSEKILNNKYKTKHLLKNRKESHLAEESILPFVTKNFQAKLSSFLPGNPQDDSLAILSPNRISY